LLTNVVESLTSFVLTVCSIYLLVIKNLSIGVYRAVHASDVAHGSVLFHGKLNYPMEISKSAVYSVLTVLGELYIVSHYFPFILYSDLGGMGCLAVLHCMEQMLVYYCLICHYGPGRDRFGCRIMLDILQSQTRTCVVIDSALGRRITAMFAMTLATNVICTALIVYWIWRSQRLIEPGRRNSTLLPA